MVVFIQCLIIFSIPIATIVRGEEPLLFSEDTLKNSHGSIIYSSVIFRHGERTPTIQYPTHPYNKKSYWKTYWPQGKGQLTERGKLQIYNLGKWFRKRYEFLISEGYRYDLLKIFSSSLDRTVKCAKSFSAGFFLSSSNEPWSNDELNWKPVPVRVIPSEVDAVIGFKFKCERYEQEKNLVNRSPEMRDYYFKHREIFDYIGTHSGLEMSSNNIYETLRKVFYLHDMLSIEKTYNLTLPSWTNVIYPEPLKTIAAFSLSAMAYSYQMRRIKAGPLIGRLVEEMGLKIQGKLKERLHFYSAHESTIVPLLSAMDIYDYIIPPFGSSVLFELRRKDKEHVVTILYRNTTTSAPYLLQHPSCGYVCKFEEFKEVTKGLIPENWQDECVIKGKRLSKKLTPDFPSTETSIFG